MAQKLKITITIEVDVENNLLELYGATNVRDALITAETEYTYNHLAVLDLINTNNYTVNAEVKQ